ncbi:TetR/AcrR family transcriptional regulator [Streptomyces sp. NPDC051310]|uniref:TetR/AcrR family transcriptional regulator n=1 Tax=Streptomyces sp. NPDC051310 TaxID=3365649 RepID=UPI0037ACA2DF
MGRPRGFDEDQAVAQAAVVFARHGYEGTSVDDLVGRLGVHRGSLYKVFGSKRGLYLAALRRHLDDEVLPCAAALAGSADLATALAAAAGGFDGGPAAGLLTLAAAEQAPHDSDVAALVAEACDALDRALGDVLARSGEESPAAAALAPALGATVLGLRLRGRTTTPDARPVLALASRVQPVRGG